MTYTGDLRAFRSVVSAEMLPPGTEGAGEAEANRAVVGPGDRALSSRG